MDDKKVLQFPSQKRPNQINLKKFIQFAINGDIERANDELYKNFKLDKKLIQQSAQHFIFAVNKDNNLLLDLEELLNKVKQTDQKQDCLTLLEKLFGLFALDAHSFYDVLLDSEIIQ